MDDSPASLAHLYIRSQNLTGRAEDGKTEQQETQVIREPTAAYHLRYKNVETALASDIRRPTELRKKTGLLCIHAGS